MWFFAVGQSAKLEAVWLHMGVPANMAIVFSTETRLDERVSAMYVPKNDFEIRFQRFHGFVTFLK